MSMIRKCKRSSDGWNSADMDVAFQLFKRGMVWDGDLCSKQARDHLVSGGYAVRGSSGMQALTGRGIVAFLTTPAVWISAWRRWRYRGVNPFVAAAKSVQQ